MRANIIIFSVALAAAVLTSCSKQMNAEQGRFVKELRAAVGKNGAERISLASMPMPPWDVLYIVAPYTPAQEQRKAFGPDFEQVRRTGIDARDDIAVLVFTKQGRVVGVVEASRGVCDFTGVPSLQGIEQGKAVFRLEHTNGTTRAHLVVE